METHFLETLVVLFGISALVVFLLHQVRIPSLVGFLAAGALVGPYGIGLVGDVHLIEVLAEIGVMLLLFTIGIEFSIGKLVRMRRHVAVAGGIQVFSTIALASLAVLSFATHPGQAVFYGFLIALSSTAIVLKILADRGESDSPHGRSMTGILIFQDLSVVPLMLLIPALAGEGAPDWQQVLLKMAKAALIVVIVILGSRWIVPALLHGVVRTRSRELFITTIILLCIGIALLTSEFGLSLALGAFLAGVVISESEYAHQATADIIPFKESFMGLFFVSIGMLLNVRFLFDNFILITSVVAVIFLLKVFTGFIASSVSGSTPRTSLQTGIGLAQVGEFSFVLAAVGRSYGVLPEDHYQVFLAASVLTMMATPFLLQASPGISAWIVSRDAVRKITRMRREQRIEISRKKYEGHVIIVGFGLNGRNLARVLREAGIPYAVLEMNNETVIAMKKKGEPIYYGDGTSPDILRRLHIERANLLVVAISDPASTRGIVAIARQMSPQLHIIVRTRYIAEIDDLNKLGANEVIPEEFETSIEIFSRVLEHYHFPNGVVHEMIDRVRKDGYTALRNVSSPKQTLFENCEWLPDLEIDGYRVPQGSELADKSIADLQVRKRTGVTIIAIRRESRVFSNPPPEFIIEAGDIVFFTGDRQSMDAAFRLLRGEG